MSAAPSSTAPLAGVGTAVFRVASRIRGERAVHARGCALTGRVTVTGGLGTGAPLLDAPGSYDAVVRFSRAVGLPEPLPDVLGLAVRIVDAHGPGAHQDLLVDSARPEPLARRLPLPARDLLSALYSSLLPYDVGQTRLLLGARPLPGQGSAGLRDLPETVGLELLAAAPHGPWRPWAVLRTSAVLPAPRGRQLRFNPWTTGGGIRPAGPWQTWRRGAYDAAHVAPDEV